jgi:futalosine hydrolase
MKKPGLPPILICAATAGELAACPDTFAPEAERFVSGVGIPATFISFWHYLESRPKSNRPHLIINIGIAGAYPDTGIAIGDIVIANSDAYGDVGMELPPEAGGNSGFLPMAEMTYGKAFYAAPLTTLLPDFLSVTVGNHPKFAVHTGRGCTVNTCTGTEVMGKSRAQWTGAVFETMEGAAVLQIGQALGISVCQIRAISNIASHRDMRPENIRLALDDLHEYLSALEQPTLAGKRLYS